MIYMHLALLASLEGFTQGTIFAFHSSSIDFIINREPVGEDRTFGRIRVKEHSDFDNEELYWVDPESPAYHVINVNPLTGDLTAVYPLNPQSYFVTIHAGSRNEKHHSTVEVHLHVECFAGSKMWNNALGWSRINLSYENQNDELRLWEVLKSETSGATLAPMNPRHFELGYRITLQQFGCIPPIRITCNPSKGIKLTNMKLESVGGGMKCPSVTSDRMSEYQLLAQFWATTPYHMSNVSGLVITKVSTDQESHYCKFPP
ncbi:unnamed protein product [Echinostoma caproni]|uniref:PTP_tm domain-containing protein n=1 Tax=Echinostoma caproni TaxID=27848 RepID=A0A183AH16_9TREM|nr:unnamed protein product [Echinostoma caproni]